MSRASELKRIQHLNLPDSYKEVLTQFEFFCLYEYEGREIELWSFANLFSYINRDYYQWELLEYFSAPNAEHTFTFDSSHDDARLYFDLTDFSVWEYWLDDDSTDKVADSFDEIISKAKLIDKE